MAVFVVISSAGLVFDHRMLVGVPIWSKPLQFAVSIGIYAITWAGLLSFLRVRRRLAWRVSTAVVALTALEYTLIIVQVIRGQQSHFNETTPFNTALFVTMGISIAAIWAGTAVLAILLLRQRIGDASMTWAVRLGGLVSVVGIGMGGLMVMPTSTQLTSLRNHAFAGIIGAHSVGVPDGGPGLPLTGWSTTGGDLRIPHFFGMHALQALPLLAIGLLLLARRVSVLRDERTRLGLIVVAAAGYFAVLVLVTWQALRGQSLIHPDALTIGAFAVIVAGSVIGAIRVLSKRSTPTRENAPVLAGMR
jgi:hypothetical protein